MKKFFSTSILLIAMLLLTFSTAYAQETKKDSVYNDLKLLEEQYGVTFFELNTSEYDKGSLLKFDSMEDFEGFVEELKQEDENKDKDINIEVTTKTKEDLVSIADYNDCYTITWWSPFAGGLTGLACWKNVSFNYTYKFVNDKSQFTSVSNIDSYLSGINIVTWSQTTNGSYNITTNQSTNDQAKIKVQGRYILGIEYNGLPIGAVIPGEWNCSLTLT
ncbi:hypothetical protein [Desulfolucanica intricata]|uniref:hypothetical protein n=1 Tax=Desulfolucanica intricata TaxID=1285191 RepID=UPI000835DB65|nr:hypothetical protein [Desulfolucanica intricata]